MVFLNISVHYVHVNNSDVKFVCRYQSLPLILHPIPSLKMPSAAMRVTPHGVTLCVGVGVWRGQFGKG